MKQQKKLYRFATNPVEKETLPHCQKSRIKTIQEHKMAKNTSLIQKV